MEAKVTPLPSGVEVRGAFDVKRFYETLAMILSQKENLAITVKVHEEEKPCEMPKKTALRSRREDHERKEP